MAIAGPVDDEYQMCLTNESAINNSIITGCAEGASSLAKGLLSVAMHTIVQKGRSIDSTEASDREATLVELKIRWGDLIEAQCAAEGVLIGTPAANICTVELLDTLVQRMENLAAESIGDIVTCRAPIHGKCD